MKDLVLIARAALACCALACSAPLVSAAQNPTPELQPTEAQRDTRARAASALARDPRNLPRAEEGRWSKWGPKDPVPSELQAGLAAGLRAYAAQDYGASLAYLHALLEREHEFPPALYEAGLCYFRLRRYGDCASMLERFVHVAPQEIGATQALGHCYYSLGDYERARAHYEKVLASSASSPEALRGLALCEMRLGNAKRAILLLSKVLELRPDHADAHAWLAQVLFDEGDTKLALEHAERARDLEPWEPRPWYLLSRLYSELDREKEADQARARFETISRLAQQVLQQEGLLLHDPTRAENWMELIALQRTLENRPALRESLPHLVALMPQGTKAALMIVDAYEWLGEKERAIHAARSAESIAGTDKATWIWLADFYRRNADASGAERATKAAAGK